HYPYNQQSSKASAFACELSLGYELQAHYNSDIYMVKCGVDSAPIYNDPNRTDFNVNSNEAIVTITNLANQLKTKVESLGKIPVFILVWIQGEGDAADETASLAYEANFNDIVDRFTLE